MVDSHPTDPSYADSAALESARPAAPSRVHTDLIAYDRTHVWHPYTSMTQPTPVHLVSGASGVRLRLADGREVIDAMSSWWCAIHGYRHPALDTAAHGQIDEMAHVMFGGLTHEPAVRLAEELVRISPKGLQHVFFADSGSVSVEVALKMAIQFQRGQGHSHRSRFLALEGGYHGDTAGAMSVCDPVAGMHTMFADALPHQVFAPRPPGGLSGNIDEWTDVVTSLVADHSSELAGVIVEPVLQAAGGMHIYNPACLVVLRRLADAHGLVLIFDEIATGFGRTGPLFAADWAPVLPDIMCVGKALTGGYLTLAATICTSEVASSLSKSDSGVLMHGPTFMANPLACSIALANLRLLAQGDWEPAVRRIALRLTAGLEPACTLRGVVDVRVLGAVGIIALDRPVDVVRATDAALEAGVWIRPFRDLIYAMPPYIASDEDVEQICHAMIQAAAV